MDASPRARARNLVPSDLGGSRVRRSQVIALVLAVTGAVLCSGVAVHEWSYHEDHPFATGVSGVLTVLSIGATLGCLAVAALVIAADRD